MAPPSVPKTSVGQVCPLWGQGQKSVLKPMGAFSIYVCGLGDVRALFLEERESRHATALRGARSRFEGLIRSFSMYVCVKVILGHCFWR